MEVTVKGQNVALKGVTAGYVRRKPVGDDKASLQLLADKEEGGIELGQQFIKAIKEIITELPDSTLQSILEKKVKDGDDIESEFTKGKIVFNFFSKEEIPVYNPNSKLLASNAYFGGNKVDVVLRVVLFEKYKTVGFYPVLVKLHEEANGGVINSNIESAGDMVGLDFSADKKEKTTKTKKTSGGLFEA